MHLAQGLEHPVVNVAPIHKRNNQVAIQVIGHALVRLRPYDAGFHIGVPLPVTSMLQEIGLERTEADHRWTTFAERTQSRINAKRKALGRGLVEQRDNFPCQPAEVFLRAHALAAIGLAILRIEKNQVDIRGQIQLTAAKLSHTQYDERDTLARRRTHTAEARLKRTLGQSRGNVEHAIGKIRQRLQCLVEIGEPENLAPDDMQHEAITEAAQYCVRVAALFELCIQPGYVGRLCERVDIIVEPALVAQHDAAGKLAAGDETGELLGVGAVLVALEPAVDWRTQFVRQGCNDAVHGRSLSKNRSNSGTIPACRRNTCSSSFTLSRARPRVWPRLSSEAPKTRTWTGWKCGRYPRSKLMPMIFCGVMGSYLERRKTSAT